MEKKVLSTLNYLKNCIFELIYPRDETCLICGDLILSKFFICKSCINKIKFCKEDIILERAGQKFHCHTLAYYSSIVSELILRLKYKKDYVAGEALAYFMWEFIQEKNIDIDLITFVPATKTSIKKRGYNQSYLLAKFIGKNLGVTVKKCLYKTLDNKDQIGLNEDMRWKNISGAYRLLKGINLEGKKVLLIDDVVTTGATCFYCALELRKSNPFSIDILTVAKSKL